MRLYVLCAHVALVMQLLSSGIASASEGVKQIQVHANMTVPELLSHANSGDAAAKFLLGNEYLIGKRVAADCFQAIHWFRSAAQQGMALAQEVLGEYYAQGTCVPKDSVEAVYWYRAAAEQDNASAQESLSGMVGFGLGVPRDLTLERFWLEKAAVQGRASSQRSLGFLFANTEPKDYRWAYFWMVLGNAGYIAEHRADLVQDDFLSASFRQVEKQLSHSQREEILKAALVWQIKKIGDRKSLLDSYKSATSLTW